MIIKRRTQQKSLSVSPHHLGTVTRGADNEVTVYLTEEEAWSPDKFQWHLQRQLVKFDTVSL